jgi:hypothetical protein
MGIDITRDSFDPSKSFTRVLMQQGRVQLDSDWNEQTSIFWSYLQTLTRDLLGKSAGPLSNCGFAVILPSDFPLADHPELTADQQNRLAGLIREPGDFLIGPGHYYVEGILCDNKDFVRYSHQSHTQRAHPLRAVSAHLIYLDVWERLVSPVEDPSIKEVALNGADTTFRAKMQWQVRAYELKLEAGQTEKQEFAKVINDWPSFVERWQSKNRGSMRVRTNISNEDGTPDATTIAPASTFRGTQNQLYRVEIHHSGTAASGSGATFKWSRDNSAVSFAIESFADPNIIVSNLVGSARSTIQSGDWIEISDDDSIFEHAVQPLRQIDMVDLVHNRITLRGRSTSNIGTKSDRHPMLRKWDHKQGDAKRGGLELRDGAAIIREGDRSWLKLENGLQVQFESSNPAQHYRTGDYWLIPARTATGSVIWPEKDGEPAAVGPRGVEHQYAPLAIIKFDGNTLTKTVDSRLKFQIQSEH